jgi:hypothetical protein
MARDAEVQAIRLRGPPGGVAAILPLPPSAGAIVQVNLSLPSVNWPSAEARATINRLGVGEVARLRLQLPRGTPPGTYSGTATVAGQARPIVVEVESQVRLQMHPKRARLAVQPGGDTGFEVTVANVGNVTVELPRVAAFGVYEVGGLDRAIGQAFRAELGPEERRADRLVDELRAGHGGLVRVAVERGSGPLAPGEVRELGVRLELPKGDLVPGRSYSGVWSIANVNYWVGLDVAGKANGSGSARRSP